MTVWHVSGNLNLTNDEKYSRDWIASTTSVAQKVFFLSFVDLVMQCANTDLTVNLSKPTLCILDLVWWYYTTQLLNANKTRHFENDIFHF